MTQKEAAENYAHSLGYDEEKEKVEIASAKEDFIAGAEWQKAKMLEGAVEGKVFMSFAPGHNQVVMADVDLPVNTKVKVIIVKEEGK